MRKLRKGWFEMSPRERIRFLWTWNPTKLKIFHACPLQFYYTYVDPSPSLIWIRLVFGIGVHTMLERFFTKRYKSVDTFVGSWKRLWFYEFPEGNFAPDKIRWETDDPSAEWGMYFGAGVNVLRRFWEENELIRGSPEHPKVEMSFNFAFTGRFTLNGRMDRVQPLPVGEGDKLVDYKTGFRNYGLPERMRDVQFTIYQLAYEDAYGMKPQALEIHRLGDNVRLPVPLRTQAHYEELKLYLDEAKTYVSNILTDTKRPQDIPIRYINREDLKRATFTPRPGSQCNFCDFQTVCEEGMAHRSDSLRKKLVSDDMTAIYRRDRTVQVQHSLPLNFRLKKDEKRRKRDIPSEKLKRKVLRGQASLIDLDKK